MWRKTNCLNEMERKGIYETLKSVSLGSAQKETLLGPDSSDMVAVNNDAWVIELAVTKGTWKVTEPSAKK